MSDRDTKFFFILALCLFVIFTAAGCQTIRELPPITPHGWLSVQDL